MDKFPEKLLKNGSLINKLEKNKTDENKSVSINKHYNVIDYSDYLFYLNRVSLVHLRVFLYLDSIRSFNYNDETIFPWIRDLTLKIPSIEIVLSYYCVTYPKEFYEDFSPSGEAIGFEDLKSLKHGEVLNKLRNY